MSLTDENQLFFRELKRLLDDYERSPKQKKPVIMEDVVIIAKAINARCNKIP